MSTAAVARIARSLARRADRYSQASVLREALAALALPGAVAVFDLDSTLLDNRPRQARILREFGASVGDPRLATCEPDHWTGWDLESPMHACGLSESEIAGLAADAKAFWRERFFTSEYCRADAPMPGASLFLQRVVTAGAVVCYVTGRHEPMAPGTLECLRRAGFPLPADHGDLHLWMKPALGVDDDQWKRSVTARLRDLGEVRVAFDNEPTHINGYRAEFPDCLAVHLDTDHSGRDVEIDEAIPSVRDFVL